MSKAERIRAQNARERIAAQQAAARKAEQQRRVLIIGGSIGLVLVVVVAFIVISALRKPAKTLGTGALPTSVASQITSVPVTDQNAVGTGQLPPVSQLPLQGITDTPLTSGGKPEMLYIGAEYCPYCAAMRWPMVVALSRFGTFGPLKGVHSSSTDVYPNTATLTFYRQKYTSQYLSFVPVEHQDVKNKALQPLTKAEQALWVKYDTTNGQQGYPFIDFGNKAVIKGPLYIPTALAGLTWAQIASKLKNPTDPVSSDILGAANYITASICKMTNDTPATVCKAAPIPTIEKSF